jgi:hypothetical protein
MTGADDRPRLRITDWRAVRKNTLRGFVVVELPSGLTVRDVSIHQKNGKSWASLPARPLLDTEGRQVRSDGKPQYAAMLQWRDRGLSDRFSAAVIAALLAARPDALDGGDQ